jgi:hypothetical protein
MLNASYMRDAANSQVIGDLERFSGCRDNPVSWRLVT